MKTKLLALLLCVLLVAGCGAASSQTDSGSSSQGEYVPSYTYVNPDPDMKLITSPGGDITYADYRLYLDISEQISRYSARQNMAVCAALEHDFNQLGIEINEEDFKAMATQELLNLMLYTPSMAEDMQKISDVTGMTQDEISEAMMLTFRSQYLISLLGKYYEGIAENELPAADAASYSEPSSTLNSEASSESSEDAAAKAEAARKQAIYDKASEMMTEYSTKYDTRLSFDDESSLVTIDGVAVPYTDEVNAYIDYMAISDRIDATSFIQAGELTLRELERRNTEFDRAKFEATLTEYVESMKANESFMNQLSTFCVLYGATVDDYFKVLERPLWLQEVGDLYYIAMTEEFNAMTLDSGNKPDSADSHYVAEITKLLEGSEIVNITGK